MDTSTLRLTLRPPMVIGARLMPAVRVAAGTLHVIPSRRDTDGAIAWRYIIEDPHGQVLDDACDLRSGTGDDVDACKAMVTLLGFLVTAAEAHRHTLNGQRSDNADLFPPDVTEWSYEHDDELAALAAELDEPGPRPRRLRIVRRYYEPGDVHDGDIAYRDEDTDEVDCEPTLDDDHSAVTLAADALRAAGCTLPSTSPGPLRPGDWWTDPDGSHIVDHATGRRCEPAAFPDGFSVDELDAINDLL